VVRSKIEVTTKPTAKDVSVTKKHRWSYWTNPSVRDAEREDKSDEDAELPELLGNGRATAWKSVTLAKLFEGQNEHPSRLLPAEIDAESELMQALVEIDEDERPDDGAVEIHSLTTSTSGEQEVAPR